MQAIILAAGKGTRMGELTKETPKCLLPLVDKTILEENIHALPAQITEVIIVVKYLGDHVRAYIGDSYEGRSVAYVSQGDMSGTWGALWSTKDKIHGKFLVLNGDDIYGREDLEKLLSYDIALGLNMRTPLSKNYLYIDIDDEQNIIGWKKAISDSPVFLVNGTYVLDERIFDCVPHKIAGDEYGLPQTIFHNIFSLPAKGVPMNYWYSFNTPKDIDLYRQMERGRNILKKSYAIECDREKIYPISVGLINSTYCVDVGTKYILQKMNPIYSQETIEDEMYITQYGHSLDSNIFSQIILTTNGMPYVAAEGELWRVSKYVDAVVYTKTKNTRMTYEAGKILGTFHHLFRNSSYEFKTRLPVPHQTNLIFSRFLDTINQQTEENPVICQMIEKIKRMPEFYLPAGLTVSVVHGDPKISNILFSKDDRACTLIDLDGCNRNVILLELGDALRSWCSGEEDDPHNMFDMEKYHTALQGYIEASKGVLRDDEKKFIPQAIKLITLELASKFLRDYYLDTYFGWDSIRYLSRKEHNLARMIGQLSLLDHLEKVFPTI